MKLVIDRKRWNHGKGVTNSSLLQSDGTMCALGFACVAWGVPQEELLGLPSPSNLIDWKDIVPKIEQELEETIVCTNDLPVVENREGRLIELFASIGIELSFAN